MKIRRYFLYNLINVYLVLLAGSLFNSISAAIQNPVSIVDLLGAAIPSVSIFFINLMVANLFFGLPMMMLRIGPLIVTKIFMKCFNNDKLTVRSMVFGPFALPSIDYGVAIPGLLYPVVVAFLYWVIAPVILLISAIYFPCLYAIYKYQFLYQYVPQFQSGGRFFFHLYKYTMMALLISAIALVGYLGLKEAVVEAPLFFPVPCIIAVVWVYTVSKFRKQVTQVVVDNGSAEKEVAAEDAPSLASPDFNAEFYVQPCFQDSAYEDPIVYRYDEKPLFDEHKELDSIYYGPVRRLEMPKKPLSRMTMKQGDEMDV